MRKKPRALGFATDAQLCDHEHEPYMVYDEVWRGEAGLDRGTLCIPCRERIIGRKLTSRDFYYRLDRRCPHSKRSSALATTP